MAAEIKVPSVGESITEGTISRWIKKDGDSVRADEPLFELETDKATTEVVAPSAGTLHITVPQGQTVAIGTVVGRIEEGAATRSTSSDGKKPAAGKADGAANLEKTTASTNKAQDATTTAAQKSANASAAPGVLLSPAARNLVDQEQVDVSKLKGTGPGGRITKEDILRHLEQQKAQSVREEERPAVPRIEQTAPPPPAVPAQSGKAIESSANLETRERMSRIRQRISERLVAAQNTAAILTTFNEADLSTVLSLRSQHKDAFQKKHGVGLGFMSFFVKAAIDALREFPVINAWIDGSDIVYHNYYHIGVAVSTERGLMVPVVRDADRMTFAEIEKRIADLAQRARDGKITVDDLQGGTFTITNGGVFGSLLSTPILNPPQSAILGMHSIQKRPVVVNDQIVIRPMMYLALSYDHRLIDGRDAVLFLVRIKECVENPERMLLEI
jgi:2-oxoglutarate dehydrogenase E2 component (dihydrolipoamide succinyltransferase)